MARITLRIPDEMKQRMDRQSEINWSAFVRKALSERLGQTESRLRNDVNRLVREYASDDSLERLWCLHILAHTATESRVYRTAELVFDREMDATIESVEADLEEIGINRMLQDIGDGEKARDIIQAAIIENGFGPLKSEVESRIQDADRSVRMGVHVLSWFTDHAHSDDSIHIDANGVERTWEIYTGEEEDIEQLTRLGLVYTDHYRSNQYNHAWPRVPDYALDICDAVRTDGSDLRIHESPPTEYELGKLLDDHRVRQFLSWMGGSRRTVSRFHEDDEIEDGLRAENLDLELDEFASVRQQLVQKGALKIDHSHGGSGDPDRWRYQLTERAMRGFTAALIEQLE